jgi:hypothetical protein
MGDGFVLTPFSNRDGLALTLSKQTSNGEKLRSLNVAVAAHSVPVI